MNQTVQKSGKKPLIIILSVVILLLVVLGILFGLALSDPNEPITAVKQTSTGTVKLVKAAVTGEPASLTVDEMNSILAAKFAKSTQSKINGIRLSIGSNHAVNAYVPINYKGIKFGVSANLTVGAAADKQISATVNSMKIGRLPVDPAWLLQNGKASLPSGIRVNGNILTMDTSLLDTYVVGDMVGVNLNSLTVADDQFVVSVSGNLEKLKEYIAQNLQSYIGLLS